MPDGTAGIENVPAPDVTASNVEPVAVFLTTTVAPGTTARAVSMTTPDTDVVWAYATVVTNASTSVASSNRIHLSVIDRSSQS